MVTPFDEFLRRNSVGVADGVQPYVHSTKSMNLREIIKQSGLSPSNCEVYNEEILYFFVGRPAYRWSRPSGSPQDWELPTCFVFKEIEELKIERVIPFDSGAHNKSLYPSYIQNIPKENFQSELAEAPRKIVSAFFGSFSNYVAGKAKPRLELTEEFSLSPFDAEVLSISTLANDPSVQGADDRRFTIEVQTSSRISFESNPPSAVILPTPYLKEKAVVEAINEWGCDVLNYDVFGLSLPSYFGQIFLKFTDYCKTNEIIL